MEIAIFACVIIVVLTAIAAYLYAETKADKRFILKLTELLEVERQEKLEWAGKALAKQGSKPLYHTPDKKDDPQPQRRVVTRAEAASRITETIEKAKEIVK